MQNWFCGAVPCKQNIFWKTYPVSWFVKTACTNTPWRWILLGGKNAIEPCRYFVRNGQNGGIHSKSRTIERLNRNENRRKSRFHLQKSLSALLHFPECHAFCPSFRYKTSRSVCRKRIRKTTVVYSKKQIRPNLLWYKNQSYNIPWDRRLKCLRMYNFKVVCKPHGIMTQDISEID